MKGAELQQGLSERALVREGACCVLGGGRSTAWSASRCPRGAPSTKKAFLVFLHDHSPRDSPVRRATSRPFGSLVSSTIWPSSAR